MPYIGLLNELGVWTIEQRMRYRKIMLYHNLVNSDDERLAKKIVLEQRKTEEKDSFYNTVKEMTIALSINIDTIETMTKAALKRKIKEQIGKAMIDTISQLKMSKMRFVKKQTEFQRKPYVIKMDATSATQVIKTRLNMIRIYGNYKGDLTLPRPCPLCKMEDDTTEHLVSCQELGINGFTTNDLKEEENIELWKQINETINFNLEKRNILSGVTSTKKKNTQQPNRNSTNRGISKCLQKV